MPNDWQGSQKVCQTTKFAAFAVRCQNFYVMEKEARKMKKEMVLSNWFQATGFIERENTNV